MTAPRRADTEDESLLRRRMRVTEAGEWKERAELAYHRGDMTALYIAQIGYGMCVAAYRGHVHPKLAEND